MKITMLLHPAINTNDYAVPLYNVAKRQQETLKKYYPLLGELQIQINYYLGYRSSTSGNAIEWDISPDDSKIGIKITYYSQGGKNADVDKICGEVSLVLKRILAAA